MAVFEPTLDSLHSATSYIQITYRGLTDFLEVTISNLFNSPPAVKSQNQLIMTSAFSDTSDVWLPAQSSFTFADNYYGVMGGVLYETIMLAEFR